MLASHVRYSLAVLLDGSIVSARSKQFPDSGRVCSLDVVELNPFLDVRGRSALLLVDLIDSLFGRQIIERETEPDRTA